MKQRYLLLVLLLLISVVFVACKKDSTKQVTKPANSTGVTCLSYAPANITSADVPATGNLNQVIPIITRFVVVNGCGGFGNFSESQNGTTKTIAVNAKYEGCVCTQDIRTIETTYNFTATTPGEHSIRFLQPGGQVLTYPIIIQ